MWVTIGLFLLGFILLIKGGDWFVDGVAGIARRFHIPELLIGATIVSIGTTLPEVMVSADAAIAGDSGISYGNAIGSIICNTALIAALTITIRPSRINRSSLIVPAGFFFIAAAFYVTVVYAAGQFSRWQGITLLVLMFVYFAVTWRQMRKPGGSQEEDEDAGEVKTRPLWLELILTLAGVIAIAIGADLLVDNGILIAHALGVPSSVIGLTMVALGTSLPELITAVTALAKGHGALSLGNIIGANLLNLVLVSGTAITISPFAVPVEKTLAGINSSKLIDIPVMMIVMCLLCIPSLVKGKIARWQGIVLLTIYVAFTVYQFLL